MAEITSDTNSLPSSNSWIIINSSDFYNVFQSFLEWSFRICQKETFLEISRHFSNILESSTDFQNVSEFYNCSKWNSRIFQNVLDSFSIFLYIPHFENFWWVLEMFQNFSAYCLKNFEYILVIRTPSIIWKSGVYFGYILFII